MASRKQPRKQENPPSEPTAPAPGARVSADPADGAPLRLEWVDAATLRPHPLNYQIHPESQTLALDALIFGGGSDRVGWAGAGLLNERRESDGWLPFAGANHAAECGDGEACQHAIATLLDGHDRRGISIQHGEPMPVLVGHWTPRQEKLVLATLDPIRGLATRDGAKLKAVLDGLSAEAGDLSQLLSDLTQDAEDALNALAAPPSLDDLANQYGDPDAEDFYPVIRVKVRPECKEKFDQLWALIPVDPDDEMTKMEILLGAVDETLLGRRDAPDPGSME